MKERGQWEELLTVATRAAALHHLEEWQCLRIDCLMKMEQYQEAKAVYDQAVRELEEEFVAKPSDALVQRFHQLSRAGQVSYETVHELTDQLQEDEPARGAYYCSYPSLIDIRIVTPVSLMCTAPAAGCWSAPARAPICCCTG